MSTGWARGSQDFQAAREITLTGLPSGYLVANEIQGNWLGSQRVAAR